MSNLDLKEVSSSLPTKAELEKLRSEAADELYHDVLISHILKKKGLDATFVDQNLSLLLRLKEEVKPCLTCPGIIKCPFKPRGIRRCIVEDDGLYDLGFERCPKTKDIQPLLDNYKVRNYPDEWLLLDLAHLAKDAVSIEVSKKLLKINANPKKGLYLRGKTGTGKSYLMAALVNSLIKTYGMSASFVNFSNYVDDCKRSLRESSYEPDFVDKTVNDLSEVDILVIDDLGREQSSEWTINQILFEILNNRMKKGKLTLITSQYTMGELMRIYGGMNIKNQRVVDCIKTICDEAVLSNINYYDF